MGIAGGKDLNWAYCFLEQIWDILIKKREKLAMGGKFAITAISYSVRVQIIISRL